MQVAGSVQNRPKLVQFGRVGKPHGFRGAFVSTIVESTGPILAKLKEVYVGTSPEVATPHELLEAAWMPKGWKFHLKGIDSDATVKALKGAFLFFDHSYLPAAETNEFYLSDIVGFEVHEEETGRVVGRFEGAETVGAGGQAPDRWWIQSETDRIAVPAVKHFIVKVDLANRRIVVRNLVDLAVE